MLKSLITLDEFVRRNVSTWRILLIIRDLSEALFMMKVQTIDNVKLGELSKKIPSSKELLL